jgi:hypothetical protein
MTSKVAAAVLVAALSFSGCQNSDLKVKVAGVASQLSANLTSVRESAETFAKAAETVYGHLDRYNLSTKGMDVKDGGIFDTFQNNSYYFKTVKDGASYYASPMKPVDDTVRRPIRIMQQLEGDIKKAYDTNGDVMALAFFGVHEPMSLGMVYPWVDVVSFLPPKLQIKGMEWYTRGLSSTGPAKWSNGPFVSFYAGWIEDVAVPVIVNGGVQGVIVLATSLEKFRAKYFLPQTINLFMLGPDDTVFIANPAAKKALDLKVIEGFDYVKQLQNNSSPSDGFRLSDSSQPEGLPEVAKAIAAGKTEIEQRVAGKDWIFYVSPVPETGFRVVGFGQR